MGPTGRRGNGDGERDDRRSRNRSPRRRKTNKHCAGGEEGWGGMGGWGERVKEWEGSRVFYDASRPKKTVNCGVR